MPSSSLPPSLPVHRAVAGFLILKIVRNLNLIITVLSVLSRIYKIRNKNECKKFNARKLPVPKCYLAALTGPSEAGNKFV